MEHDAPTVPRIAGALDEDALGAFPAARRCDGEARGGDAFRDAARRRYRVDHLSA
ncbi:hypothetical protein [Pseudonocardia lacus]|uniref:hypothetical protein n=1 Tax=Pseudonocardia lacus TaxID=2835865 RepID=UPI001BDCDABA|nr:hypothetical protein [Pseudonocardia lacus]